jgi:hypothetical protein
MKGETLRKKINDEKISVKLLRFGPFSKIQVALPKRKRMKWQKTMLLHK